MTKPNHFQADHALKTAEKLRTTYKDINAGEFLGNTVYLLCLIVILVGIYSLKSKDLKIRRKTKTRLLKVLRLREI